MKWLINNDLFIIPRPCIFACSNCQITLFRIVIIHLKKEIPDLTFLNQERVSNKFGRYIGHILCPKKRIHPTLQFIEVKRTITAVNANSPLFTLGNERDAPLNPDYYATNKTKRQAK